MGKFAVGSVVLVSFPFSNLKARKIRPALVVAQAEFNNVVLCQITSKPYSSRAAIKLTSDDFISGKLPVVSYIRPDKLFTADTSIIEDSVGSLTKEAIEAILKNIRGLFVL